MTTETNPVQMPAAAYMAELMIQFQPPTVTVKHQTNGEGCDVVFNFGGNQKIEVELSGDSLIGVTLVLCAGLQPSMCALENARDLNHKVALFGRDAPTTYCMLTPEVGQFCISDLEAQGDEFLARVLQILSNKRLTADETADHYVLIASLVDAYREQAACTRAA